MTLGNGDPARHDSDQDLGSDCEGDLGFNSGKDKENIDNGVGRKADKWQNVIAKDMWDDECTFVPKIDRVSNYKAYFVRPLSVFQSSEYYMQIKERKLEMMRKKKADEELANMEIRRPEKGKYNTTDMLQNAERLYEDATHREAKLDRLRREISTKVIFCFVKTIRSVRFSQMQAGVTLRKQTGTNSWLETRNLGMTN